MRPIEFRAKKINGGWVYGSLVTPNNTHTQKGDCWIMTGDGRPITVTPETIGQYIEVEDLNHKKIYQGDIMQHTERSELTGIVRFSKGGFFVVAKTKTDDRQEVWQGLFMEKHCVVIGNAFDNPQLMDWWRPPAKKGNKK